MEYNFIKEICRRFGADFLENEPLAEYTSFRIGGGCPVLVKPNGERCLCELLAAFNRENAAYRVMGKGSNLLISDRGISQPVIMISSDMGEIGFEGDRVICGAGASLIALCREAADRGLGGAEFAYGIPGSVGGAVYMNAGAYGGEMKDIVLGCTYADEEGKLHKIKTEDMELSYRHSFFCGRPFIITQVEIGLHSADKAAVTEKMSELMNRRREKQPLEYPSAGSTFKRPEGDFAGRLIEAAGLRGFGIGGAQVSEKHCGFVVNKGGAGFDDVIKVIGEVKRRVRESSGRELECEVIVWEQ